MCKLCVRPADVWRLLHVRVYIHLLGALAVLYVGPEETAASIHRAGAMRAVTEGSTASTMHLPRRGVAAGLREGRVAGAMVTSGLRRGGGGGMEDRRRWRVTSEDGRRRARCRPRVAA